jgi:hypothetical protein
MFGCVGYCYCAIFVTNILFRATSFTGRFLKLVVKLTSVSVIIQAPPFLNPHPNLLTGEGTLM